jgi:hypothetical protein
MATTYTGDYTEVRRVCWSEPRPPAPNGSTVGGTDYYTAIYSRMTWAQDGGKYAGRTYEDKQIWIGPSPDYMHVLVGHSNYPAEER